MLRGSPLPLFRHTSVNSTFFFTVSLSERSPDFIPHPLYQSGSAEPVQLAPGAALFSTACVFLTADNQPNESVGAPNALRPRDEVSRAPLVDTSSSAPVALSRIIDFGCEAGTFSVEVDGAIPVSWLEATTENLQHALSYYANRRAIVTLCPGGPEVVIRGAPLVVDATGELSFECHGEFARSLDSRETQLPLSKNS